MSISIHDAVSAYLVAREAAGLRDRTIDEYQLRLGYFVDYIGPDYPLDDIGPDKVDSYLVHLRRRKEKHVNNPHRPSENGGLSKATISGYGETLKTFFTWCVNRQYIKWNPARHVKRFRKSRIAHNRAMDPDNLVKMLKYLELAAKARNPVDVRDLAILALMADSLARRGEVSSINLSSIDFNKSFKDKRGRITYQAEVDGKVGPRLVTFSEATALYLLDWLDVRPEVPPDNKGHPFFVALCRWHDEQFGKCTSCRNAKNRLTSQAIYLIFKRLGKRAGVEGKINPHAVRHLGGIMYAERAGIEVAQEKLGHTSIMTTRQFYVPPNSERVRDATSDISIVRQRKEND